MKALQGQSIFDIAVQELGSAEAVYDLAVLNGLSVTDVLEIGQEILLPAVSNKTIADYYSNKLIKPATGDNFEIIVVNRVFFEELSIEFS